jgi:hypothetical protein
MQRQGCVLAQINCLEHFPDSRWTADDTGRARDEPGPFNSQSRFDRPLRLACSHAALSTKTMKDAITCGRQCQLPAELLAGPVRSPIFATCSGEELL